MPLEIYHERDLVNVHIFCNAYGIEYSDTANCFSKKFDLRCSSFLWVCASLRERRSHSLPYLHIGIITDTIFINDHQFFSIILSD